MFNFSKFQKPQRYIGNELNVIKKDHYKKTSFCLCYPNLYEIGMDNLGLRIIYGLLNSYPDIVCERCFLPGSDLQEFLEKKHQPLFSLETKTPLLDFDLIGFNFGYELNYLNFLQMLESGGVCLKSKNRKKIIVLGGGVANPEPLADFVDVFCLGDFEAVSNKLVEVLRKHKDKASRLKELSQRESFYVPQFYDLSFSKNYYQLEKKYRKANPIIKQSKVKNLDKSFFPLNWITPHTKLTQDRVPIEIARGCPNNCNFCQARNIYYPYREKKVKTILNTIKTVYKNSGYERFSLLSLSTSNYSQIKKLINAIFPFIKENKISINLPSLRIGDEIEPLYKKLLTIQKTSLTVAIEAGRPYLRKKINKNIAVDKLFDSAASLHSLGLRMIKVYFMYGFPKEEKKDLLAIGNLIKNLLKKTPFKINISINLFIPKPFSPWENKPLLGPAKAKNNKKIILTNIPRSKRLKISFSNIDTSLIEAIISRGDRNLGPVFVQLHKRRKELIEKNLLFSWPAWKDILEKKGINWQRYIKSETKNFPWSFIKDKG
ncbi:MAG: TIGR03960 family B12-binding radical SAM protein [Candidatus Omnitrophica bacterium]|nr:TIGR03960 family B12-binding radical SAM protein [Candidatus Omnitrophota bacterium]MCF7894249.1 TIGR03960 family B12-binding radical SAM protein [Candidatus Omnitrophota bacterium]